MCLVHRDRRGAMARIEPEFDKIRGLGVELLAIKTRSAGATPDTWKATVLPSLFRTFKDAFVAFLSSVTLTLSGMDPTSSKA